MTPVLRAHRCGTENSKDACVYVVSKSATYKDAPVLLPVAGDHDEPLQELAVHLPGEYVLHSGCAYHTTARNKCPYRRGNISGGHKAIKVTSEVHDDLSYVVKRNGTLTSRILRHADVINANGKRKRFGDDDLDNLYELQKNTLHLNKIIQGAKVTVRSGKVAAGPSGRVIANWGEITEEDELDSEED